MSDLTVRFWGTRGSIPTPGRTTEKFGGNTSCVEVRHGDTLLILDAGSGIREMGMSWLKEFSDQAIHATLLFTHQHWDHIQGFPFFTCAYQPQNSLTIYGEERLNGGVEQLLRGQMSGGYFPVHISDMHADLKFKTITKKFRVGDTFITPFALPHPGGVLSFRIETDEAVFVFATDCELDAAALNQEQVRRDHEAPREYPPELLDHFRDVHLLVIDCQYTDENYKKHVGWGHNSIGTVVDLCAQVKPDMLALFHHDPQSTDDVVKKITEETAERLQRTHEKALVFAAREGLTVRVEKPKPPPKRPDPYGGH